MALLWVDDSCFRPGGEAAFIHLRSCGFPCIKRFKKSDRLLCWFQKSLLFDSSEIFDDDHIVVTNWKEAKPCVFALSSNLSHFSVALVAILCIDGQRSFENAINWSRDLSPEVYDKILICRGIDELKSSLVLWRCRMLLNRIARYPAEKEGAVSHGKQNPLGGLF